MEQWKRLGAVLGAHMHIIVPCCVVIGVLLPDVFSPLSGYVPYVFAFMTFQGALGNTVGHLVAIYRRPAALLSILFISAVLMPSLAYLAGNVFFGGNQNIVAGIVLEYCVPIGVSSLMWVEMNKGDMPLALASVLTSTVLAPFSIPLMLKLLLGASVEIDVVDMMTDMIFMIALPALAGMLVNDLTHGWGARTLSPVLCPASRLVAPFVLITNSTKISDYVLNMTWEHAAVALFICVFAATGYLWGILGARLLHRDRAATVTMSFESGMRNISSGAVIASQYFPGETVFPVMIGTMFQHVLAALFARVVGWMMREDGEGAQA